MPFLLTSEHCFGDKSAKNLTLDATWGMFILFSFIRNEGQNFALTKKPLM